MDGDIVGVLAPKKYKFHFHAQKGCFKANCPFSHDECDSHRTAEEEEHRIWDRKVCRHFVNGTCEKGQRCSGPHDEEEKKNKLKADKATQDQRRYQEEWNEDQRHFQEEWKKIQDRCYPHGEEEDKQQGYVSDGVEEDKQQAYGSDDEEL